MIAAAYWHKHPVVDRDTNDTTTTTKHSAAGFKDKMRALAVAAVVAISMQLPVPLPSTYSRRFTTAQQEQAVKCSTVSN
jgi:hypothetical protein